MFCNQIEEQFCSEMLILSNKTHQGEGFFCAMVISLLYFVQFHLPPWKELLRQLFIVIRIMRAGALLSLQLGKSVIFSGVSLVLMRRETGLQQSSDGEHWCCWRS